MNLDEIQNIISNPGLGSQKINLVLFIPSDTAEFLLK